MEESHNAVNPGRVLPIWPPCSALLVGFLLLVPISTHCQEPDWSEFRIGGGLMWSGGDFAGIPGGGEVGAHGLAAVIRMVSPNFGYRADGWIGGIREFEGQDGLAVGTSVGLQLAWVIFGLRHYAVGGISYNHTPLSSSKPLAHDLGTGLAYGFEVETGGRRLFIESSSRWFGNVFRRKDSTRSIMLITAGVAF